MPHGRRRKRTGALARSREAKPLRRISAPAVESVLGASATPRDTAPADSSFASIVGSSAHQARHEDAVTRLVNAIRTKSGLPPLRTDERLRAAARGHSKDMARRDFCAHVDPDGRAPADRMRAAGHPRPGGENVARGQEDPRTVVQAWLDSPGHRANLLNAEFTTIGVGVHFLSGKGPYWTQNFGY
ncbi:CAP domain-containing protein [Amycolatopsis sp. WQ 127309]|uniref:CAP domain-containing protein n=1 Tax=Amycolatopsis sp. WQ 127309 TaxID=2932773 RepID=UPI001FF537AA|nr:CAP domain-containing protein [Amycolatopsis sp. WQ 127309]UOZ06936.1 CAP domain-containing protein [Amycolatopsis sp. WQ 127309]